MKKILLIALTSLLFSSLFAQVLNVELGSVPATAVGQCTGKVWVHVTGGVAPYSFMWNNAESSTYQENLCLGTYSVTVTDASSATAEASVEFSTSSQIIIPLGGSVGMNATLYGQCDGIANIYVSGGIAPYNYQIFDAQTGMLIIAASSTNNLCAGEYYAVATDANNGTYFYPFAMNDEFIRDNPSQFQWAYPTNQMVSFNVAGEPPFTVSITNPNMETQNYTIETSTSSISYIPILPGNHTIHLIDFESHSSERLFCAYDAMNLLNISATTPSNGCDGTIMTPNPVNITMNYETSPGSFQTIFIENGTLCPGNYMVMVQDMMCPGVMNMAPVTVTGPAYEYPIVDVFSSNTIYNICTGMAWLDVTGGNAPYSFNWINYSSNTNDFINNLCSGNLFVKVTDAYNVWSIGYTYIESDLPETVPGDTISASYEECISDITASYIFAYTVNQSNVLVTWAIEHAGIVTYLDVTYNYIITLPGVYNVELVINCPGTKSTVHFITELDITLSGINNDKNNELNIYPNPVNDILNISFNENVESLEITSITGAVISSFAANGTQMIFNVSELSAGVYMIRFINYDGSTVIKKFVK